MSVKLIGSEPEDEVPDSFYAYLNAREAEVIFVVPAYMEIPFIDYCQREAIFDTCAGLMTVTLKDLIEDYANNCLIEDGGDGILYMASFFEQAAKRLRDFHKTLDLEDIAAAKLPVTLVFPEDTNSEQDNK